MNKILYVSVLLLLTTACARSLQVPPPVVPAALRASDGATPTAHVTVHEAQRVVEVYAGPFHVPVADPDHHDMPHDLVGHDSPLVEFNWPVQGWFRGFRITLHDQSGRELPRDLMHHLIGYNLDRPQLIHSGVERLFGIGLETGEVVVPEALGVPLDAGTNLAFNVTWHNETGEEVRGAYVRLILPYTPHRPEGIRIEGLPIHADVNYQTGTTTAFDLPPGRSVHTYEFEMPIDGGIIGVGAHLHDYGVEVRFEDAETDKVLFRLRGIRNRDGSLRRVEQKVFRSWFGLKDARIRVQAGRRYRVVGVYDNPTGRTLPFGAMAHFAGLFAPNDISQWPRLNPDDPKIQADLAVLRASGTGGGDHDHHHGHHDH